MGLSTTSTQSLLEDDTMYRIDAELLLIHHEHVIAYTEMPYNAEMICSAMSQSNMDCHFHFVGMTPRNQNFIADTKRDYPHFRE